MDRKPLTVMDGPLEGDVYELALALDEQTELRLPDGRIAVYRAAPDRGHADSTGHGIKCLRFVGFKSAE